MRSAFLLLLTALPLAAQHIPALAEEIGAADPSLRLESMTLQLTPSPAQRIALQHLLAAQQNPASADFHRWLTPEEFGDRFGLSHADMATASNWLRARGFRIESTARARTWIHFSGTAAQVQSAFHVEVRRYRLNGQIHYTNSNKPVIPAELSAFADGVQGLDNFPLRATPLFNNVNGHFLVPDDVSVIYDVAPLAKKGITGAGVKIGIPGGSVIPVSDIDLFRKQYNLPANEPQIVLVGADPGTVAAGLAEGDLDVEWTGAMAPGASIIFAYSQNLRQAEHYLIDNNLVNVISTSYGVCETGGLTTDDLVAQQANAQGITWISSSGDGGAAYCDSGAVATHGLTVAEPASFPEVTAVGATTFNEGSGTYWAGANGPNFGSALSYIPEIAWNDTASLGMTESSSGGASSIFPKPVWQNAPGVPADGMRDIPDVSLSGSLSHDAYIAAINGQLVSIGGTSVSTPVFAGMIALLNHSLVANKTLSQPGLGNINPVLYNLARTAPSVFHDVTQGNNFVNCQAGSPNCVNGTLGYSAGPGYDQVTGLGSIDFASLAAQWSVSGATTIAGVANGASFKTVFAQGMVMSVFGTNFATAAQSASSLPLPNSMQGVSATINGQTAPLYFVSSGQVNLQVPYGIAAGTATLSLIGTGGTANFQFTVQANAPGIFAASGALVPISSGKAGDTLLAFVTGEGAVSPSIATGATPGATTPIAQLPKPTAAVSVTVGGVNAPIAFVGIPSGLAGVTQINFLIPAGVPAGSQPVVVTVGGVASAPVSVGITN